MSEQIGLVGRKSGMTQLFTPDGNAIPVTIINVLPNRVTQVKTLATDGYNALQITTGEINHKKISKSLIGHYLKANVQPGLGLWEFPLLEAIDSTVYTLGSELSLDIFNVGQSVHITGTTKGKGFSGVIKRHHFSSQDATHGNSLSHRAPGSIGQRQSPGRVFKGKRMSGQLGNKRCTIKSQLIMRIDKKHNLLFIKGSVPGAVGGFVVIRPSKRAISVIAN